MFTQVLLYFRALEFSLFTLFCDILMKAHSHADLRRNAQFTLWDDRKAQTAKTMANYSYMENNDILSKHRFGSIY